MRRFIPLLVAGVLAGVPALASAADIASRYGAGAESTITGSPSIVGTYWVTDRIGAQATLSYVNANFDAAGTDDLNIFLVGASGVYNVFKRPRTHLGIILAAAVGLADSDIIRIHAGIRPELFVTDWLTFHATVGATYLHLGDKSGGPFSDVNNVNLFQSAALAQAGLTFYFGGQSAGARPSLSWEATPSSTIDDGPDPMDGTTDTTDDTMDDSGDEEGDDESN